MATGLKGRRPEGTYLFCFLYLIGWLATVEGANSQPLKIASSFNWVFWSLLILCFIVGFLGQRNTTDVKIKTWRGETLDGYIDYGPMEGTDGFGGAIALSLAYISSYMAMAMISPWKFGVAFPTLKSTPVAVMIFIGAFAVLFLFYASLLVIRLQSKIGWIIFAFWIRKN